MKGLNVLTVVVLYLMKGCCFPCCNNKDGKRHGVVSFFRYVSHTRTLTAYLPPITGFQHRVSLVINQDLLHIGYIACTYTSDMDYITSTWIILHAQICTDCH
jgi:hypothetical protein